MIDVFTIALLTTEFGQVWAEYVYHDITPQLWQKSEGKHLHYIYMLTFRGIAVMEM